MSSHDRPVPQDPPSRFTASVDNKTVSWTASRTESTHSEDFYDTQRSPLPWKYVNETSIASPNEDKSRNILPVLRLIPRPGSSTKQTKMKILTGMRSSTEQNADWTHPHVITTPSKTHISDRLSLDCSSPIPSLLSTPLSTSPHSFSLTPPSVRDELGGRLYNRSDSFASLNSDRLSTPQSFREDLSGRSLDHLFTSVQTDQVSTPYVSRDEHGGRLSNRSESFASPYSGRLSTPQSFTDEICDAPLSSSDSVQSNRFYFTPLEKSDEWTNAVDASYGQNIYQNPQVYQVPALVDAFSDEHSHLNYLWWNAPSPLSCNGYSTPDGSSITQESPNLLKILGNNQDHLVGLKNQEKKAVKEAKEMIQSSSFSQSPCPLAPQNLKGDPQRQAKVKTELCIHYLNGTSCPFGDKCNYAHGDEELKYSKLVELQQAGLINDIHTYRTHPCLSWVSTGACPFGQRCVNIHDPRIEGPKPSWLPHSEVPSPNAQTDVHIDLQYHHHNTSMHQVNPLVQNSFWKDRYGYFYNWDRNLIKASKDCNDSEWCETYALVCNMEMGKMSHVANTPGKVAEKCNSPNNSYSQQLKPISEIHRSCIAALMSYDNLDGTGAIHRNYVYNPRFLVFDKLCMILQTRYFLLLHNSEVNSFDNMDLLVHSVVREISIDEFNGRRSPWDKRYPFTPKDVVTARELAFGACGETSAYVSLWFELPTSELIACTQQQIKKHKRANLKLMQQKAIDSYESGDMSGSFESESLLRFEMNRTHPYKPFYHVRPIVDDDASFNLIRSMLHHRIKSLLSRSLRGEAFSRACIVLGEEESKLQDVYDSMKCHIGQWKWFVTSSRVETTANTVVPSCNVQYDPCSPDTATGVLWNSFVLNSRPDHSSSCLNTANKRLPVFQMLGTGLNPCKGGHTVPHITFRNIGNKECETSSTDKSALTWKSILLNDERFNDWKLVIDHYKTNTDVPTALTVTDGTGRGKSLPLTPVVSEKKMLNAKTSMH